MYNINININIKMHIRFMNNLTLFISLISFENAVVQFELY